MKNYKKKKSKYRSSRLNPYEEGRFNIKLFLALSFLLLILLMKKYNLSIGDFNVDTIYDVVYYNEDFERIKDQIFILDANQPDNAVQTIN